MFALIAYVSLASAYVALYIAATIQFFKLKKYMESNYKNLSETKQRDMVFFPSFWRRIGLTELELRQCAMDKKYQKNAKIYNRTLEFSYAALGLSIPFATFMVLGI